MFANEVCHRMSEFEENVYSIFFYSELGNVFSFLVQTKWFLSFSFAFTYLKCLIIKNKDNNGR